MDPTVDLDIDGMTCASCAAGIEQRLNRLAGVEVSVNYSTERCRVAFAPVLPAMPLSTTRWRGPGCGTVARRWTR